MNPTSKQLRALIEEKQTRLCVNPDVTSSKELLRFADLLGPYICVLKTHIDIIEDFTPEVTNKLNSLSKKHGFLLFEDRKFADIGTIAKMQYAHGVYHIASWAHITNAHPVPGPGVIKGLQEVGLPLGRGLLLVAEMSSAGSLAKGDYTRKAVEMAKEYGDFVIGFISQHKLTDDPRFLHFSPGVKLEEGTDTLGQQYRSPHQAIVEEGCDIIIVGRGITHAKNPTEEAEKYRRESWLQVKYR